MWLRCESEKDMEAGLWCVWSRCYLLRIVLRKGPSIAVAETMPRSSLRSDVVDPGRLGVRQSTAAVAFTGVFVSSCAASFWKFLVYYTPIGGYSTLPLRLSIHY